MKGRMITGKGKIVIDTDVIAKYAGSSAVECFGIVGMASVNVKDGLWNLLRIDNINHGVEVTIADNSLEIHMHIIVAFGVSIKAVAANLISNVKYRVEEFTGMEVSDIIVSVEGVRVTD